MVIRCLTEAEATQLRNAAVAPATSSVVPAPPVSPSAEPVEKRPTDARAEPVETEVISVTADEGELAAGRKKLRVARDKYARCVSDNGGLSSDVGEVTVRFLVRERGRAEGTSVEKRHGVSEAAANCIAAVIDRRPVGTPEGPLVGATAVVRVTRSSNTRPNR